MHEITIDPSRIDDRVNELGEIGKMNGILWRAIYTDEEKKAKDLLKSWMVEAGLEIYEDTVGNLFGRLEPFEVGRSSQKVIMIGSHLDTVKDGGNYDGAAGIIAGIEAVSTLYREYGRPKVPVEVVALLEEEGSRFSSGYIGSRAIVEGLTTEELEEEDENGISLGHAMTNYGYEPSKAHLSKRDDIGTFMELHIEQGPVLERSKVKIGLVEKITGIAVFSIEIIGREDHGGTTPMDMRLDALLAASKFISELPETAMSVSNDARVTVGTIDVKPGSSNVIPNKVKMLVDLREVNERNLTELERLISDKAEEIKKSGYGVSVRTLIHEKPTWLDKNLLQILEKAVDDLDVPSLKMNCGAGHDSQIFSYRIPSSLILIPCKDGRSHSPKEYASPKDMALGTKVLADYIYKIAWKDES